MSGRKESRVVLCHELVEVAERSELGGAIVLSKPVSGIGAAADSTDV